MKKRLLFGFLILFMGGCVSVKPVKAPTSLPPQEVTLRIEGVENVKVSTTDKIQKMMEVESDELTLSKATRIKNGVAYMTVSVDAYRLKSLWEDFQVLKALGVKEAKAFMCSEGGSAMIGMAITDLIDSASKDNIHITMEAAGIIGSAAVSVFLAADHRVAHKNTIFLIHPATLFKYLAAEQLDDLRSQEEMLTLTRDSYLDFLIAHSSMDREQAEKLIARDSWFTVEQAKKWDMVDEIK